MTNKEIANQFKLLAQLMELHGEEPYRLKSYNNAYRSLRAVSEPLIEMSLSELKGIKGVGDAISRKIQELQLNQQMRIIEDYLEITPKGIVELLGIKGLGIKKIMGLWKEMDIQSPGELLYACNENRLTGMKGFGAKTQNNLKEQLEYYFQSQEKYRWASIREEAEDLVMDLQDELELQEVAITGQFRRLLPVVDQLEILIADVDLQQLLNTGLFSELAKDKEQPYFDGKTTASGMKVRLYPTKKAFFGLNLLRTTGNVNFIKDLLENQDIANFQDLTEAEILQKCGLPFLPPETRDFPKLFWIAKSRGIEKIVSAPDIKGMLHLHSTYSDGANTLKQMADYIQAEGYQYMGITDHSKSAFYANGLKEERLEEQWKEIDELNKSYTDFRIFKGIESDIKYDGSLDYEEETLAKFDFIIASVHAHLKMNEEKATERILTAIKNPYTDMLGHPTGRLLLARPGYPLNHKAVIDACAKYEVAIEINANPLRLDLDYEWLPYALEQGVKIAINPDAHSTQGIHDTFYGIQIARKGLLSPENCINCWSSAEFEAWLKKRRSRRTA